MRRILTVFAVVLSLGPAVSHAEEPPESRVMSDRLRVRLSGVASVFDTDIAAGKRLGLIVSLEDDLNFDKRLKSIALGGFYRFGQSKKNAIRFAYTDVNRDAAGELAGQLEFWDEVFVGEYASSVDTRLLGLAYRRNLFGTERGEAGVTAGLSTYSFDFSMTGSILVEGEGGEMREGSVRNADVIAPIPTLGLFLNYGVRHDLIFEFGADYLSLSIGDYAGGITQIRGSLSWFFTRHVGAGLGFASTDIRFEKSTESNRLFLDFRETTAVVFVDVVF